MWHHGTTDEYRYDTDLTFQCSAGFQPDEVVGIIEAATPSRIGDRGPFIADDDDQDPARTDRLLDRLDKVEAWLDALDIHEYLLRPEMAHQTVIQASGVTRRIIASITDEDAIHADPAAPRLRKCRLD